MRNMIYTYKKMEYLGQYVRGIPHPAWVGAAVAGAAALANMIATSRNNSLNLEENRRLLRSEQDYQRQNNREMYSLYRHSLEGAGMNLNSQLGGYPNTSSPTASTPNIQAPQLDLSQVSQLIMQDKQLEQDKELKNKELELQKESLEANKPVLEENARSQRIENDRRESEDAEYYNADLENTDFGTEIPELKKRPYNKGTFEARKNVRSWKSQELAFDTQDSQNNLRKLVADQQIENTDVVDALVNMPYEDYKRIMSITASSYASASEALSRIPVNSAHASYLRQQIVASVVATQIQEDSSLHPLIDKYFKNETANDIAHGIVNVVSGISGSSLSFKGKTIQNKEGNSTTHNHTHTHNTTITNKSKSYRQGNTNIHK